jgi:hypothetical protein
VTRVYIEGGSKRVFACACEWPGWCRSGKDEPTALAALAESLPRYLAVVAEARLKPAPTATFDVVDRVAGSASTDFGVPGSVLPSDSEPLDQQASRRQSALVEATWVIFDRVVAAAPLELTKGPRGGGRDRDRIVEHVLGAETAYLSKLGIRARQPDPGDRAAIENHRAAILQVLGEHEPKGSWPLRYAARRIAWHVLDHAWEIENRIPRSE